METTINMLMMNYLSARQSWECWCFTVTSDRNNYNSSPKKVFDDNPLLNELRRIALKDVAIELYKIIGNSDSNKDNVFKVLKKFKIARPDLNSQIEEVLGQFATNSEKIERITTLRNKYFAHRDANYAIYENKQIPVSDIDDIFIMIENALILVTSKETVEQKLILITSRSEYKI